MAQNGADDAKWCRWRKIAQMAQNGANGANGTNVANVANGKDGANGNKLRQKWRQKMATNGANGDERRKIFYTFASLQFISPSSHVYLFRLRSWHMTHFVTEVILN
jgi:hypothetical protein